MGFTYKDIYIEDGYKILKMNILPEKYCNFDCIFCPIGRANTKKDDIYITKSIENDLNSLSKKLIIDKPDLVFINSKGEALFHSRIKDIITFIKSHNIKVRLLSNGYLFGISEYSKIANLCDEVIGEIKTTNNIDFAKIQRPLEGYTVEDHISNMANFNKTYKGIFIFEITIIKGYSDDDESIQKIKRFIDDIKPSKIIITSINDAIFKNKLGITEQKLNDIKTSLLA